MANWCPIIIEWTRAVPDKPTLEAINGGLGALDNDAPELTEEGMEDQWRSPLPSVDLQVIVDTISRLGYPVRAQWAAQGYDEEIAAMEGGWLVPGDAKLDGVYEYHEFMQAYCWYFKHGPGLKLPANPPA